MVSKTGKAGTGVAGLDEVLAGGFSHGRTFLVEGEPGAGKTTLALQFLLEGARANERSLYITLSETAEELREAVAAHGWSLGDEIEFFELASPDRLLDAARQQTLLYSSDLELGEAFKQVFELLERLKPDRVVVDSLSEIRLLAQSALRYRHQILALKHFTARYGTTVVLLEDMTSETGDQTVRSIAHGVVRLEELAPTYGSERRRLRVLKYRGQKYRGGYHDFTITKGGLNVFPRLVALDYRAHRERTILQTGITEFDSLLGGGIQSGTSTLILGPAGTGKSLLALTFIKAAIARGETAALFVFDEELGQLFDRMKNLLIDLEAARASGALAIEQVDTAELSPGEFAHKVRETIEPRQIRTVVIDSLNGYQSAMPEESSIILHMHELLQYLNRRGATTFITVAQHGLVGEMESPVDVTYLADAVILLRYFEASGKVRRAISVIKKRSGWHETSIREFRIDGKGISMGGPLEQFQGVLRGVPEYVGEHAPLLDST